MNATSAKVRASRCPHRADEAMAGMAQATVAHQREGRIEGIGGRVPPVPHGVGGVLYAGWRGMEPVQARIAGIRGESLPPSAARVR